MTIYTRTGDDGSTSLYGNARVPKTNPRIEAYGTVDEANSLIGTVVPTGYEDVDGWLREIQNHLHIVQAEFANPDPDEDAPRIRADHVDGLERWIDACDDELAPLRTFLLPGGGEAGSKLHHARAVVRRAERRAVSLAREEAVNECAVTYLNRLSDALFTFARLVNKRDDVREDAPTY